METDRCFLTLCGTLFFYSKMGKASPRDLLTEFCLHGVLRPSFFLFAQMCSNFPARRCTPGLPSSRDVLTPHSRETRGAHPRKRGLQFPGASLRASLLPQSSSHMHSRALQGSVMQTRDTETDRGQTGVQRDRNGRQRDIQRQRQTERAETEREKSRKKQRKTETQTDRQRLTETDGAGRQSTGEPSAHRTGPARRPHRSLIPAWKGGLFTSPETPDPLR